MHQEVIHMLKDILLHHLLNIVTQKDISLQIAHLVGLQMKIFLSQELQADNMVTRKDINQIHTDKLHMLKEEVIMLLVITHMPKDIKQTPEYLEHI